MVATGLGSGNEIEVVVSGRDNLSGVLSNVQGGLLNARTAVLGLGTALAGVAVGGMAASVSAARDYNAEIRELTKVTNEAVAARLGQEMVNLSKDIPLATTELTKIATAAARFGVAEENVAAFTETVSKMAFATDLTVEEAGQAFAKLSELTNTPIEDVENLGSAINSLGQNAATSTGEIVDGMLRSSAALNQLGLQGDQIAGLQASLNEVSASSRRAGTRLRRVAQELMDPRKVEDLADAFGMTVDEFTQMRDERPGQLIVQMAEAFAEGDESADAFRETLSTASRQALAGLGQNIDGVRENLERSSEQFDEATSLQREYEIEANSLGAEIQRLQNELFDIGRLIGNQIIPHIKTLVRETTDVVAAVADWTEQTEGAAGATGLATAAVGGLLAAIAAISAPIAAVVAAVAGLAVAWRTNFANIRGVTDRHFGAIRELWAIHGEPLMAEVKLALADLRAFWDQWGDEIMSVVEFVFDFVGTAIVTQLDFVLTAVRVILNLLQGDWEGAWEAMAGFGRRMLQRFGGFVERWNLVQKVQTALDNFVAAALQAGQDFVDAIVNGIEQNVDKVGQAAQDVANEARSYLPGSDAERGPLSDLTDAGAALPETLARGAGRNAGAAAMAGQQVAAAADPRGGGGGTTVIVNTGPIHADSREGGRAAARGFEAELPSLVRRDL